MSVSVDGILCSINVQVLLGTSPCSLMRKLLLPAPASTASVLHADLSKPIEVFQEMHRVLKPGGKAIMSFSNRCFPTKGALLAPCYFPWPYPLSSSSRGAAIAAK